MADQTAPEKPNLQDGSLAPGSVLGGYEIVRLIGLGGTGRVYEATQLSLDRRVALKVIPCKLEASSSTVRRFLDEIRLTAQLEHPNIVTVHEADEENGTLFLAMEYIRGKAIDVILNELKSPLDEKVALDYTHKVAEAMDYAWRRHRLVHRDIKPANMLLSDSGILKVCDLGLAIRFKEDSGITQKSKVVGTPHYISPEQARGHKDLDFRADIYSLGASLYHMVTGHVPYDDSSVVGVLTKHIVDEIPNPLDHNPELIPGTVRLIRLMMAKSPDQRHRSWQGLIADIDRVLSNREPIFRPPKPTTVGMRVATMEREDLFDTLVTIDDDRTDVTLAKLWARIRRRVSSSPTWAAGKAAVAGFWADKRNRIATAAAAGIFVLLVGVSLIVSSGKAPASVQKLAWMSPELRNLTAMPVSETLQEKVARAVLEADAASTDLARARIFTRLPKAYWNAGRADLANQIVQRLVTDYGPLNKGEIGGCLLSMQAAMHEEQGEDGKCAAALQEIIRHRFYGPDGRYGRQATHALVDYYGFEKKEVMLQRLSPLLAGLFPGKKGNRAGRLLLQTASDALRQEDVATAYRILRSVVEHFPGEDGKNRNEALSVLSDLEELEPFKMAEARRQMMSFGPFQNVIRFNGELRQITIQETSSEGLTIECWLRTESNAHEQVLVSCAGPNGEVELRLSKGRVCFSFPTLNDQTELTTNNVDFEEWHHIAATLAPNGVEIFIDGESVIRNSCATRVPRFTRINVGTKRNGKSPFRGTMQHIMVSPRVLYRDTVSPTPYVHDIQDAVICLTQLPLETIDLANSRQVGAE